MDNNSLRREMKTSADWKGKVVLTSASVDKTEDIPAKYLRAQGWDQAHNVWVGSDATKADHVEAIPTAYVIDRQSKIVAANPVNIADVVTSQSG